MAMSYKKLGKGATAGNYYLTAGSVDDYYLNDGVSQDPETMREPPGTWFDPAGSLPMAGANGQAVTASDFQALLAGYDPTTGEALVKGAGPGHVAGFDFTFSAPKGLSAIWSQLPADMRAEIDAAQAAAVQTALQYMSDKAGVARLGAAGCIKESVPLMAAVWPHGSSRENDPQIHTHCVVLNLAKTSDGAYRTVDTIHVLRWQSAIAAAYHAELAAQITERMGIKCEVANGEQVFDCVDVVKSVREHWSKRAKQIREQVEGKSDVSKAMLDKASISTREKKSELTRAELLSQWAEEGKEIGFTEIQARECLDRASLSDLSDGELQDIARGSLAYLTRTQSVFTEPNMEAAITVKLQGFVASSDIRKAIALIKEKADVVRLGENKDTDLVVFTTPEMIEIERAMVNNAGEETAHHVLDQSTIEATLAKHPSMSEEQAEAMRYCCTNNKRVSILEGGAGTGKTFSAKAVIQAHEAKGYKVHGLALSWSAAGVLSEEAKLSNTRAIEGFVRDIASGKVTLDSKSLILVDEAGLVGSRHMATILEAARVADAKVILTGDSLQLAPVDAGGALTALVEDQGSARIDQVRRQGSHARENQDVYESYAWQRDAVMQLAHGDAKTALEAYNAAGSIHFAEDHTSAIDAMVKDWIEAKSTNPQESLLLLAVKNEHVKELNAKIREHLQSSGSVEREGITLKASDMRNAVSVEFAVGDRIMFRLNDKELGIVGDNNEQRTGVFNRTQGTIRSVAVGEDGVPTMSIELAQGGMVNIRAGEGGYWDKDRGGVPIQHAYATTVYASQGMTVDRAFLLDSHRIDRKSGYVAASRHKQEFRLYIDRDDVHDRMMQRLGADEYRPASQVANTELLETVVKQWSRAGDKVTTLQFIDKNGNPKEQVRTSAKASGRQVERPTGGEKDRARAAAASFDERKVQARGIDLPAWLEGRGYTLSRTPSGLQLASGKTGETWSLWQAKEGGNWLARQPNQKTVDSIGLVEKLEGVNFREAVTRLDTSGVGQAKRETPAAEQKTSTAYDQVARLTKDARAVDLPAWLSGRGERVEKNGTREFKIRQADGQALRMFQSDKDSTWLITDGRRTFDPIGYVQQREGCTFQEAVKHLAGDHLAAPPVSPPVQPRAPAAPIALRHASAAQHAAGLRYLQGRGISRETTREALEHGFLAIDNRGPAFVGRDAQGQIRSAETRLMTPFTTDAGDVLTKVSYERTDKTYSPILPGDPRSKEVHLVESGMDALALRDIHRRDRPSEPMPAVVVTGGARTLKWRDNPQVVDLLRKAESVTIHKENEKDESGRPNPKTQADTDAAHEKQMEAVSAIRGSDKGLQFERPNEAFKDLAERNAHEVQAMERARRDQEEEENKPRLRP